MKKGEFIHPDSIKFPDSLKYYTPAKRLVYGGGGIMPDVFIPMDTTTVSSFYVDLRRKRIINDFIVEYVDAKRDSLKFKFTNFDEFNKIFKIDNVFMNNFYEFAKKQGVEKKETEKNTDKDVDSEKFLICQIKALLASNMWGSDKYYRVIIDEDNEFKKALEIIGDEKIFKKLKISF
jgi:carboxyl-terminal processing protease